jgi:3-hydroxyisobutyrate dehydrogenase-like beta-hydroxyacid dehydrogenase
MSEVVGILHPGQMGISVAASAKNSGLSVCWTSEGRSLETRERAESQGLIELKNLTAFCQECSIIFSVCPPHAAEEVARIVIASNFKGLYVDANAISPNRTRRIGMKMEESGIEFVDGGIIGGPAWEPETTWLYLSGDSAERVAACFSEGPLGTVVMENRIGNASAVKMCFAAYTKGSSALLCAILATADRLGVREALEMQWSRGGSEFAVQTRERLRRVTAKAWRFAGEMDEIADTMAGAGLPEGFHRAAGEVYRRMSHFKGLDEYPPLEDVLEALKNESG